MLYLATQGQDMLERPTPRRLIRPCSGHVLLDSMDSFHLTAHVGHFPLGKASLAGKVKFPAREIRTRV